MENGCIWNKWANISIAYSFFKYVYHYLPCIARLVLTLITTIIVLNCRGRGEGKLFRGEGRSVTQLLIFVTALKELCFNWDIKHFYRTFSPKSKTNNFWNYIQTFRPIKVSWNIYRQFKSTLKVLNWVYHILGDINNVYENGVTFREENKKTIKGRNKVSSKSKKYLEFEKTFGLKQIAKRPAGVNPTHPVLAITYLQIPMKNLRIVK